MIGFKEVPIRRFLTLKRQSEATTYTIPAGAIVKEVAAFSRNGAAFSVAVGTAAAGTEIGTAAGTATQVIVVDSTIDGVASATSALTLHITPAEGTEADIRITYDEYLDSNGKQPNQDGNEYLLHDPV